MERRRKSQLCKKSTTLFDGKRKKKNKNKNNNMKKNLG